MSEMDGKWNMKRILVALTVVTGLTAYVWLGTAQVIGAGERLHVQTQAAAQQLANQVVVEPVVTIGMDCAGQAASSPLDVPPTSITGDLIVRTVPAGCQLTGATVLVRAGGEIPEMVPIRADGISAIGTVKTTRDGDDVRIHVAATGETILFRRDVTAEASAQVPIEPVRAQTERHLTDAVAAAAPVIVERETGENPERVIVESPTTAPVPTSVGTTQPSVNKAAGDGQPPAATTSPQSPPVIQLNPDATSRFTTMPVAPGTTIEQRERDVNANRNNW